MPSDSKVLKKEVILRELEEVRALSEDGLLHPEKAVAWARQHRESEIYKHLEWNDGLAAEQYRVEQVRQVIRVVVINSSETDQTVRAYISTPTDRVTGGGYRQMNDALMRARQELINEALKTLENFGNRYAHLPELDTLFSRISEGVREFRISSRSKEAG